MTDPQVHFASFVTDCIKILGAVIVFAIGLQRYLKAEKWKRGEFIAAQIKDFEADRKIQLSMAMLDWSNRRLCFQSDECDKATLIKVNDALLSSALLPHTVAGGYYSDEMTIRDCIDHYLDMLMRIDNFVTTRLIKVDELRPYIKYWIKLTAGKMRGHHSDEVFVLLLNYIQEYDFEGAARLIRAFGYDPLPAHEEVERAISNALKNRWHPKDQSLLP